MGLLCSLCASLRAQHSNDMTATLRDSLHTIEVKQHFSYLNTSKDTLKILYFNDWANAYADKHTALAKRFSEEFKKSLHLAREEERGRTTILSIVGSGYQGLQWERVHGGDILKIDLDTPLPPGGTANLFFTYSIKLPANKFTPFGYDDNGAYYLKDWYLTPAVYDSVWHLYSNKNLEDLYTGITNTTLRFIYPKNRFLTSNLAMYGETHFPEGQYVELNGKDQRSAEIILSPVKKFTKHVTPTLTLLTDIESDRYEGIGQEVSIARIAQYLTDNLGPYPHDHLLVAQIDYQKDPLYGINQLPSFIRPFDEQFQFELQFLKTAVKSYLRETLFLDPRKQKWVTDAISNYLMIDYVDTYYPNQPFLGKLSKIWGLRSFHLAEMDFNDQYPFLYMLAARKNWGQPLTTPNDSLIKFNQKIANPYKAGLGLDFMANYIGKDQVKRGIKSFYETYKQKKATPSDFEKALTATTDKNIGWFFKEYVPSQKKIDFTIKNVYKDEDSVSVVIRNKSGTNVPISLYGLSKDSVVYKRWVANVSSERTVTVPRNGADRMVLNYDQIIPEFNQRDNWKTLNGFFSSNKRLKLQFFKDAENPYYNQVFYVPVMSFNIYDGVTPGMRLHNKTLLERPFVFDMAPSYSFNEHTLVGYGRFNYRQYHGKSGFYVSNYSLGGSTFHFREGSRYSTVTPSVSFGWRPSDLRSNKRTALSLRYVNVFRNLGEDYVANEGEPEPDYGIFNLRYSYSDAGIIDYFHWYLDAQHSNDFSKLALTMEYRKLFENNRQFNFRLFAGKFLRNNTTTDYFNFALDRPTDYLFEYNYLGRSEDSGLYSQQLIVADGGFKSKLHDPFSNDWIVTTNNSFNLWKWIELYSDLGVLKSTGSPSRFVYDSGVRLNLVTDYFELYFPIYSNNGWEIAQPEYDTKIRFIVTLSPRTLIGLFTRKWF